MTKEILNRALLNIEESRDFSIVTVVETQGSVPSEQGSKMLVTASETEGTIGGGALEKKAVDKARELLCSNGRCSLVKMDVADLGMKCGGTVTLLFEPYRARHRLVIFGGGHVSQALAPLAAALGFSVTVVDDRPEFADKQRFPHAAEVILSPYLEAAKKVASGSFVVIVTHGHVHDEEVLKEVARLDPPLPYIGMIGSRNKVRAILEQLKEKGFNPGTNIYSPIGLALGGGGTPAEIAVSIASEMVGVSNGKENLPHLRVLIG